MQIYQRKSALLSINEVVSSRAFGSVLGLRPAETSSFT